MLRFQTTLLLVLAFISQSALANTFTTTCLAENIKGGSVDHTIDAQKSTVTGAAFIEVQFVSQQLSDSSFQITEVSYRGKPAMAPEGWDPNLEVSHRLALPDDSIQLKEHGILEAESRGGYGHIWARLGPSGSPVRMSEIYISGLSQIHSSRWHFGIGFIPFKCVTK